MKLQLPDQRSRDVVQLAAKKFGWSDAKSLPPGHGRGFGFVVYETIKAYCAVAVEIAVNSDTGQIRVVRAVAAGPETLLADNGYFSEANVMACTTANIEPLIATGRQPHHPSWRERFAAPPPAPENPTPVEAMAWHLRTPQGKQLYGLRKQTPEPVFGIIKSVMGFRQFLLRGLDCVRGEWSLVTMAWNIKRMHALSLR
jgi:hypothetical protein